MISPSKNIRSEGGGPDLVLVHGTASDAGSFAPLVGLLRDRLRVTRYDRRGTPAWPAGEGTGETPFAEDHAQDLADVIAGLGGGPVHLFGASFGGVVVLELTRRRPELVRSATLFEPALAADAGVPPVPHVMLAEFEKWIARGEPERAAELFHRRVLSDALWRRLSPESRRRALGLWRHIHADLVATTAYRVRHESLRKLETPFLLLRGGRSREAFEAPVQALAEVLPRARRAVIPGAGHQTWSAAWRDLAEAIAAFSLP